MMNNQRRLHPVSILVLFLSTLKSYIIPLFFGFFIGGSTSHPIFNFLNLMLVFLILTLVYSVLYWLTFYYDIEEGELKIRSGVLIKKVRYIRRERVHSIDLTAGIIQRMFHLVKVRVETAGGGLEPEVQLVAIKKNIALDLRNTILNRETSTELGEKEEIEEQQVSVPSMVWSMKYREIFVAAITSSGVGIVFSAIGAILSQIEPLLPEDMFYNTFFRYFLDSTLYHLFLGILLILVLAWIISILMTVITYANFTITKEMNDIKIVRGLLEKRELTINEKRITAVRIVSSIFRQPFGYVSVYVESGGGGTKEEQLSTVFFPLLKKKDLPTTLGRFLPEYSKETSFQSVPKRAWIRYQLRVLFIPTILIVGMSFFWSFAWYFLLMLPLLSILAYLQFKDAATGITEEFLFLQFRKLNKSLVIVQRKNIQSAEAQASFIQRLRNLATIQVSILSSITGKSFAVNDMERKESEMILDWYSYNKITIEEKNRGRDKSV